MPSSSASRATAGLSEAARAAPCSRAMAAGSGGRADMGASVGVAATRVHREVGPASELEVDEARLALHHDEERPDEQPEAGAHDRRGQGHDALAERLEPAVG